MTYKKKLEIIKDLIDEAGFPHEERTVGELLEEIKDETFYEVTAIMAEMINLIYEIVEVLNDD